MEIPEINEDDVLKNQEYNEQSRRAPVTNIHYSIHPGQAFFSGSKIKQNTPMKNVYVNRCTCLGEISSLIASSGLEVEIVTFSPVRYNAQLMIKGLQLRYLKEFLIPRISKIGNLYNVYIDIVHSAADGSAWSHTTILVDFYCVYGLCSLRIENWTP